MRDLPSDELCRRRIAWTTTPVRIQASCRIPSRRASNTAKAKSPRGSKPGAKPVASAVAAKAATSAKASRTKASQTKSAKKATKKPVRSAGRGLKKGSSAKPSRLKKADARGASSAARDSSKDTAIHTGLSASGQHSANHHQTTMTTTHAPSGNRKLPSIPADRLVKWLRDMHLIREFEVRCMQSYQEKKIGGFCHVYIGQEAVAVGCTQAVVAVGGDDRVLVAHGLGAADGDRLLADVHVAEAADLLLLVRLHAADLELADQQHVAQPAELGLGGDVDLHGRRLQVVEVAVHLRVDVLDGRGGRSGRRIGEAGHVCVVG